VTEVLLPPVATRRMAVLATPPRAGPRAVPHAAGAPSRCAPRWQPGAAPLRDGPKRRVVHTDATLPGEDAPGTGRRRFPEEVPCTREAPCPEERAEPFAMKTTEQAYEEFPTAVRASFPLYVRSAGPQARPCRRAARRGVYACGTPLAFRAGTAPAPR